MFISSNPLLGSCINVIQLLKVVKGPEVNTSHPVNQTRRTGGWFSHLLANEAAQTGASVTNVQGVSFSTQDATSNTLITKQFLMQR